MYGPYNDYGGWGIGNMMGGFGGGIIMIAFWFLFLVLIIWVVREMSGKNSNLLSSSRALDILKERYVKGEINKEEFESKKKDIGS